MAQSNFRREILQKIQAQTGQLVSHVTKLDPSDENFGIAEEFIMNNITNNSYQDTNENDVRRMITALQDK